MCLSGFGKEAVLTWLVVPSEPPDADNVFEDVKRSAEAGLPTGARCRRATANRWSVASLPSLNGEHRIAYFKSFAAGQAKLRPASFWGQVDVQIWRINTSISTTYFYSFFVWMCNLTFRPKWRTPTEENWLQGAEMNILNNRAEATDDGDTQILRSFIKPTLHIVLLEWLNERRCKTRIVEMGKTSKFLVGKVR